jgi:uncharacterized protein YcfL
MRAVALSLFVASLALCGCHKQEQQTNNSTMSMDEGMPNQVASNADLETLPADESSTTPSNQLQNGFDDSDVGELNASNSQ